MLRKSVGLLLAMIIIISGQMGFAVSNHPVDSSQIIIAEPTSERITNDKQIFVTVNITNVMVIDHPITMSLVRIENRLPFADALGEDLNVSFMKLSSNAAGDIDRSLLYNTTYSTTAPEYSEGYVKETQVINRFFELKDLILAHNYEIATINKKYRFDLIVGNTVEIAKLTPEVDDLFKQWTKLKANIAEYKKEYVQLQLQYSKYFENQIMVDKISNLSFYKIIGKLPNGTYKIRFLDDVSQLIKEFTFEVVDKENTIQLIDPMATKAN
ncbi:hypothetical protein QE109_10070 [Fusibacter bizertensis]|uniref:Uncharacterized protein n=1 Tax=Fusibacter bizertensis TaxID=1488331 RepID=A0ABT6NDJ5_9FIRM|nr:hypothetical protein [Fusibacter bizertensis]MDH8678493.1 hypothetical protein [Fusibacter bizertensis]